MKRIILTNIFLLCLTTISFAQLRSGTYEFRSTDLDLENINCAEHLDKSFILTLVIDYDVIESVQFSTSSEVLNHGGWMRPSQGWDCKTCDGWYQFSTNQCSYYDFDIPKNGITTLRISECGDDCDSREIGLTLVRSY
ncbi:MAG: hypothetical protein ACPGYF_08310 [Chitinophagales bacterium]